MLDSHRVGFCGFRAGQPTVRLGITTYPPWGDNIPKSSLQILEAILAELLLRIEVSNSGVAREYGGIGPCVCVGGCFLSCFSSPSPFLSSNLHSAPLPVGSIPATSQSLFVCQFHGQDVCRTHVSRGVASGARGS